MEFLGKMVKKDFKGFGVFDGVVDSYDSTTGFFKILYEDGDSEEADLSEVERLVAATVSSSGEAVPEQEKVMVKRVGRKPKRRRRGCRDPGKGSENLRSDSSLEETRVEGIEQGLGQDLVNEICVSANGDLNDNWLDLNHGLNFDDGVEKFESRGCIDLNLTVVNDEFDEGLANEKKEHNFDLNLGLSDDNLIGVNEALDNDACVRSGQELQNGVAIACDSMPDPDVDANHVNNSGAFELRLEESCADVVAPTPSVGEDGNYGRRKRRRVSRNLTSPTETVLRRSARRAKAMALNERNSSGVMLADGANDLAMSGVMDESEEKPSAMDLERPPEPWVLPPKIELPPSSTNLNLEGDPVLDLFFVYSCLRSFSTLLYLSPFELEDLVAALKSRVSNLLIDFIHVSMLQTLRKHLEFLANEGSESASTCLRNMNWDLLDVVTWPVFMVEYLLIHGSGLKPGFSLDCLNLFDGEYYSQPANVKLELLRCLCDDVIEVEATRSELSKRMNMADATMEIDRTLSHDLYRKSRFSTGARGDTNFSEDIAEEVADGNSDECCLCKMDGNLICCDGCPAAYHTKCVGIVSSLLPDGDWYCPECMVGKSNLGPKPQKLIRGADLLGIDPYGRLFFSCFDYLLVSDSYDAESLFNYYHKDDLGAVIELLRSYDIIYESILSAISQQWAISTDLHDPKSDLESKSCILNSGALDGRKTRSAIKCNREVENPHTSSEGSAEVLQSNQLIPNSPRTGSSEVAGQAAATNAISAAKQRKKIRSSAGRCKSFPKTKEEDVSQGHSGDVYMNCYSFAWIASSIVEELLRKPSDKVNVDIPKTEEEIISIQLKFILRKSTKFSWPAIQDLDVDRQKEKCGWCYCCRFLVEGRECLFSFVNKGPVAEGLKTEVDAVLSKKNKKGHLVDVICCLLFMEQRLQGLLLGPWLSPSYCELWRKSVLKASDVLSLRRPLLMLESNLHPLALSADWWKHVDSVARMGSASHYVASSRAVAKTGTSRKKRDSEIKSLIAAGGLGLFWWRGGRVSRSLFNWKVVPRSLALKAARNAGRIKLPGIIYPDGSEHARRSKCVAWRAAVEASTSVEQLALQVRELDMFLRWDDIENTHHHSILDKESVKSIRLFKKVIIRRKCVEGTLVKYLLDFGKRRCIPDVVIKHGIKVEDPSGEKKKYWLEESYVPLHLVKSFEERRITRKASKTNPSKARKGGRVMKKPLRKKGFDYLFSKAERADSYQCGHCNKHVPISEAVSCQHCKGFFHKRHVLKSSEAVTSESTYTCHKCRAGKHVKNESMQGKRKWGKLQVAKNLKVERRGRPPKLRAKACKNGKALARCGTVFSGNNKKRQYRERRPSLEDANVTSGMTLRRSARRAYIPVQSNNLAGGKKRKRKRNKSRKVAVKETLRNVAVKETPKSSSCQKRRTRVVSSFWVNGLLLSKKPNDERVLQFKRRKLLVPSEFSTGIDDPPRCCLCSEEGLASSSTYIACEICGDWFHGNAFGLNEGNIGCLIGFKCHLCRERSPPACCFRDISRDTSEVGTQNAQESPEEYRVQKETDCVLDMHSDEVSPGLLDTQTVENLDGKFQTVDNFDSTVDGKTPILDSELRVENGLPNSKLVDVYISTESAQVFHSDEVSVGPFEFEMAQNSDGNLVEDKTAVLDSELKEESGSLDNKVMDKTMESQSGDKADLSTGPVQESCSDDASPGCIKVQMVPNSVRNLDHFNTPLLDPTSELDKGSPASEELIENAIDGQSGEKADLSGHVQEFRSDDASSGCLEVQMVQNSVGNLDQVNTTPLEPASGLENGSTASEEVIMNAIESQSGSPDNKVMANTIEGQSGEKVDLSIGQVQDSCSDDASPGCVEVQMLQNSVGNLDHVNTPLLDPTSGLDKGSPASKEVTVNAIESQSGEKADLSKGHIQEVRSDDAPSGCLEFQMVPNSVGNLDQFNTSPLEPGSGLENGSTASEEVIVNAIVNAIESQSAQKADLSAACVEKFLPDYVSLNQLEVQTVKTSAGNLGQVETSIVGPDLRMEIGSPAANREVMLNAIDCQNGDLKANISADRGWEFHLDSASLSCFEIQTVQNSVGYLDQARTLTLDSELKVENGSPASKKVMHNTIGSQSRDLKADLSTACLQEFQCDDVLLSRIGVQTDQNSVGKLDQVKTSTLEPQLRAENGSLDSKELVSNAIESQQGDLDANE